MNILGINFFFHDSSACLVQNGRLVVALEEERFNRRKHTWEFPVNAIQRCLEHAGAECGDIDHIAVSIKPTKDWHRKAVYGLRNITRSKSFLRHEIWNAYGRLSTLKSWYMSTWPDADKRPPLEFVPHHACHAVGTFLVSPFEDAAILSLDGSGEWSTSFLGHGQGRSVRQFSESYFPMSLGSFYETATQFCGFRPNYDEGKTMGLAPMGDSERFYRAVSDIVQVNEEGRIKIDLSYFAYQNWGHYRYSQKFIRTFGEPRSRDGEFESRHLDVAAAFQRVLEDRALEMCRVLKRKTSSKHLVISGGVSLNSVMNGRLIRESGFDDLYVMPAAGDNGTAIGAAYVAYNQTLVHEREFVHDDPYVGNGYTDAEITKVIRECKLAAKRHDDIEAVGAELLYRGEILGWYQGRMEIGPRALGNRSILANPTLTHMKDKINADVKHREAYRPFAPSATLEGQSRFFEDLGDSPFMLKVCHVLDEHKRNLPAITHVDGSARLQTVHKDTNPRYHGLIQKFGERTGVPVVLNTSFNIMGEPIVESPIDAIRCFFSTGIDSLVLGDYLICK
ncbi:carbamoyltransferase family protein [Lentisalinibacter sediminis]|uniref:carbamoyltransferase family protein n=1 Tax=Lentisalinibacter sediminis TaxID=2992237 RepID=UPI0038701801